MEEAQSVEGEAEVEAINVGSRRVLDKLTFYKFTRTWRFDVPLNWNAHESASPVIRTRHEGNKFNFAWRLAYNKSTRRKFGNDSTLSISLLSFDKRHLEVCVRCYFDYESCAEMMVEERAFDFSSEAPIEKEYTPRSIQLQRFYDETMLSLLLENQNHLSRRDQVQMVIRVDFEFFELDQYVRSSLKLAEDLETQLIKHNDEPTDVTFQIDGKELKAHKCVLAARSPVFAKMFESRNNRYPIYDIEADVFQHLLSFVYCGKTDDARSSNKLTELRLAAEKFGLTV